MDTDKGASAFHDLLGSSWADHTPKAWGLWKGRLYLGTPEGSLEPAFLLDTPTSPGAARAWEMPHRTPCHRQMQGAVLFPLVKRPFSCQQTLQPGQRGDGRSDDSGRKGPVPEEAAGSGTAPALLPPASALSASRLGASFKKRCKGSPRRSGAPAPPPPCRARPAPTWPPVTGAHGVARLAQEARVAAPPEVAVVRARDARQAPQESEAPERRQSPAAAGRSHGPSASGSHPSGPAAL